MAVKPGFIQGGQDCPPGTRWDPDLQLCVIDCPPGTTFDPFTQQCITDCPAGTFWDPILERCVDEGTPEPGSGGPVSTSSGSTTVNVNVNNTVNITDQILSDLSKAVQSAIDAADQDAAIAANKSTQAISEGIGSVVSSITGGVNSFLGGFGDFFKTLLSGVANDIGQVIGAVKDNIGSIIDAIPNAINTALKDILPTLNSIINEVQKINDTIIQPITTTILGTIQTIGTLTTTLERDLSQGLEGILKIPEDLSTGLTGLDATLQRAQEELGGKLHDNIGVFLGASDADNLHTSLKGLGQTLGSSGNLNNVQTTFKDKVGLADPNISGLTKNFFDALAKDFGEAFHDVGVTFDSILNKIGVAVGQDQGIKGQFVTGGTWLVFIIALLTGELLPLVHGIEDIATSRLPTTKLDTGTALAAWMRGFIEDKDVNEELSFEGFDATRIRVLKDLQVFLADPQTALDWWRRGIIPDADLNNNLKEHGITIPDQDALKAATDRKIGEQLARELFLRGEITEEQTAALWRVVGMSADEISAQFDVIFNLESQEQVMLRLRRQQFWSEVQYSPAFLGVVPEDVKTAGKREGNDSTVTTDLWQAQFMVPPIQTAIELYFRGKRTLTETYAVMNYWMVPEQLRQDLIDAHRPLIPFRTIPAMVKAGILTQTQAATLLGQHGYDQTSVNALLAYSLKNSTPQATATAAKQHAESVQVAQQLFDLGAITKDQYAEVLKEHDFTPEAIQAEIQLAGLKQQLQQRKDVANEIIAEALSGQLTYDQAAQNLTQQGFTATEQAKYLRQLRSLKKQSSKLPSEAQLVAMVKNNIIDQSTFTDVLVQSGYSADWADKITTLHFAPATTATS